MAKGKAEDDNNKENDNIVNNNGRANNMNINLTVDLQCRGISCIPRRRNLKNKVEQENKPKEVPVPVPVTVTVSEATVHIPCYCHCHHCGEKLRKLVSSYRGVNEVVIDKDIVTMKGRLNVNRIVEKLKVDLHRPAEILPTTPPAAPKTPPAVPTKISTKISPAAPKIPPAAQNKTATPNPKNSAVEKEGGGNDLTTDQYSIGQVYGDVHLYGYGYGYGAPLNMSASQIFSDENATACSIM